MQTDVPEEHSSAGMTWQQEEDFAQIPKQYKHQNRWHRKKPAKNNTKNAAHSTANGGDTSALAQQSEPRFQPKSRKPASRAPAADSPSSHHTPPAAPANASLSHQPKAKHVSNAPNTPQNDSVNNKKNGPKHGNMTRLRKEAYIPPHMRKRNSANDTEAVPATSGGAANDPPASSNTSKSTVLSKADLTPNRAIAHQATPPSPATTPCEPAEHRKSDAAMPESAWTDWGLPADKKPIVFWDDPPPEQSAAIWGEPSAKRPPATRKAGKQRRSRGPHTYKKHVWPKNRDMKHVPSGSCSDGGVPCWSDSNGDPDYDVKKLLDWNGDWLPAPESWSARRPYDDRRLGDHVEQWINGHSRECTIPVYLPPGTFSPEDGVCKELVPRCWLEAKVEGTNLRESWKIITASRPGPLDSEDLSDDPPWWELYEDVVYTEVVQEGNQEQKHIQHASCYLNALPVPEARIDSNDPEHIVAPISMASAEDKVQEIKRRIEEKQRRTLARLSRPIPTPTLPMAQLEDRRLRPTINMYIRPVQPADVAGITVIYNYYIEKSICATEFDVRTEEQMRQRINTITSQGLPYLVAISKRNSPKPTPGYVSERIIGYTNLDDYCSQASLFRYTFEMELFVHPGYLCKGIGKCLVDRLLEIADTSYRVRGGYEYVNNFEYLKTGPARVIKTILLNVHHENGEDAENGWQGKFLHFCKFYRVGRLPKVGYKLGKVVDVAVYAHHTKEDIDPKVRPTVSG